MDAALSVGVPILGWCPSGGLAEDLPDVPGLLTSYPQMIETPLAEYEQRTLWNVRDAHATLIIIPQDEWDSYGTKLTIEYAKNYERPLFIATPRDAEAIARWLEDLGYEITLNVAGPRESLSPGIYDEAFKLMVEVLLADIDS
jgi:hypothetical protein